MKFEIDSFASLQVVSVTSIGTFLDWGEAKDLFLPFSEQTRKVQIQDWVVVFIYLDHQDRPCASMKVESFLSEQKTSYQIDEKVKLRIYDETDLGFKALVNDTHTGLIYKNEIFKTIAIGQVLDGYVKKVRDDQKIDLNLRPAGHDTNDDIALQIIELLEQNNGFYRLTDKTSPDEIYALFGVSKKKYKIALGHLYKKRIIQIEDQGIRLTKPGST